MNKKLVISGINFFEGGPLSIFNDCLSYINSSSFVKDCDVIALVHKVELFDRKKLNNIEFVEFPKSRSSYLYRLYYEYIYFYKYSKKIDVAFWLSLHDITPRLYKTKQAVYCHNAAPFGSLNLRTFFYHLRHFIFSLFYKYIYKINIKSNRYIIVQQSWLRDIFADKFDFDPKKIIVAIPQVATMPGERNEKPTKNKEVSFFFPTYPRPFKNIEIIGEAVTILNEHGIKNFKVYITVDGSENKYARRILKKYGALKNIDFIGLQNREKIYDLYEEIDCLIFPSKLESWGLPISEFKQYGKPMLVADLPYARETVGDYPKAKFFKIFSPNELATSMRRLISDENMNFEKVNPILYSAPFARNWEELFKILLD